MILTRKDALKVVDGFYIYMEISTMPWRDR